ncbi:hypothetical protein CEUSTIGMA_g6803.t1 [Chlamydomonas eustigma]|uniref:Uncharacterized protein n=1 Tax=Chlamydomonas eustigma TaxID=1157962 RepID=A0A250X8E7_9CHLO|nr:hypothetical protein CEUSTIGMA_g6803.t1 [Chlamydomonas eustigma]|eukprot:GAX79361.1 hypothetical protein CEUSTIGMA_g6803.t1 [Chlamydomonas eustigma]
MLGYKQSSCTTSGLHPLNACLSRRNISITCSASGGAGSSGSNSSSSSNSGRSFSKGGRGGKAKAPGLFEISVATPPPRSLGIYALPPLTHNGEEIEVEGAGYVVTSVVVQFKLRQGKYVREHNKLEVLPTGRWLLNLQLESLLKATYIGPPGSTQD